MKDVRGRMSTLDMVVRHLCDQCDRRTGTPQYFPTRNFARAPQHLQPQTKRRPPPQPFAAFTFFFILSNAWQRPDSRHIRPSAQVSSFDTDKLRTADRIYKNKWSGRTRLCVRAPRHLTTQNAGRS